MYILGRCAPTMALFLVLLFGSSFPLQSQTLSDATLAKIEFDQKLNTLVTPDLNFVDENGQEVKLGVYFHQKPIILVLGYYECPMLCSLVLNGLIEGLQQIKWSIGQEFDVVCVSINPRETPALAAAKKRTYLRRYARQGAAEGWHFLTGPESSSRLLAREVGFQYAYEATSKQFAHPSGVVILTPEGRVSGYLFGVTYLGAPLHAAIKRAASHEIGSPIERLILLCFHYNPITGKYGAVIMRVVRVLGALTFFGLVGLVVGLTRRSILRARQQPVHP